MASDLKINWLHFCHNCVKVTGQAFLKVFECDVKQDVHIHSTDAATKNLGWVWIKWLDGFLFSAFLPAFTHTHTHTPVSSSGATWGSISWSRILWLETVDTGKARNWTTNFPVSRWAARPPEPQPSWSKVKWEWHPPAEACCSSADVLKL